MNSKHKRIGKDINFFLALIKEVITDEACDTSRYVNEQTDWETIIRYARKSNVEGLLYEAVLKHPDLKAKLSEYSDEWREKRKMSFAVEYYKYAAIKRIMEEAEKEQVRLVFFKGMVLAELFPQFYLRPSTDTDIFVYERDKDRVAEILYRLGYVKSEDHSKANVPVFVSHKYKHVVEVHYSLWEDYEGKTIAALEAMELTSEQTLIDIVACKLKFSTFGHEQHFIYQMFHIIKHFITDSIGVRYLMDTTLFVNKYGQDIDFNRFWIAMEKLGYKRFCINLFNICVDYFNMDSKILQGMNIRDSETEQSLLLDMIHKGQLYETKTSPWQILGIMTPYLVGEEKVPVTGFKRKMKILFPSAHALPEKFAYAKNNKGLLPVAWAHKILDFIWRYKKYNKVHGDWYNGYEKLDAAEYRLDLIKKLGF